MKRTRIYEHGGTEKLVFEVTEIESQQSASPLPFGHVRVRIKFVSLNHLDLWVRRGVPGHKFPLPLVPGSDFSGVVEFVGEGVPHNSSIKVGSPVVVNPSVSCGQCSWCLSDQDHLCHKWGLRGETCDGGFQEWITVPWEKCFVLSDSIQLPKAACLPINYVTSYEMLHGKAKIKNGETILILAGGSGVSVACLQLAKLSGLNTIVCSTDESKLLQSKKLGADHTILWPAKVQPESGGSASKASLRELLKPILGKSGVDVVVDHVGHATLAESIKVLRKGGRLVSCGATTGGDVTLDWKMIFFKNIALLGSTYGPNGSFAAVGKLYSEGLLNPVIHSQWQWADIAKAHEILESGKVFGKVLVNLTD